MEINIATIVKPKNPKMHLWMPIYEMKVRTRYGTLTIDITTVEKTRSDSERFAAGYLERNFKSVQLVSGTRYRKRVG